VRTAINLVNGICVVHPTRKTKTLRNSKTTRKYGEILKNLTSVGNMSFARIAGNKRRFAV